MIEDFTKWMQIMKPVKGANKQPYSHPLISLIFKFQKWKAATRCSTYPLTTGHDVIFFYMSSLRNRGWYPARAHPFSSGNGQGNWNLHFKIKVYSGKGKGDKNVMSSSEFHLPASWKTNRPTSLLRLGFRLLQDRFDRGNLENTCQNFKFDMQEQ